MDNSFKVVLDLCGGTESWSEPYREAGYDVRLVTLPNNDVRTYVPPENVYGVLAAPPCTTFSKAAWQIKKADRDFKTGMETVRACLDIIWPIQENGAPLKFRALENPQGYLYNFLGRPAYWSQPWQFGERDGRATKRTALWGYFNEPRRTCRKRTIPFISPHSRPAGDGSCDRERINKYWGRMSVEERARTSEVFAITTTGRYVHACPKDSSRQFLPLWPPPLRFQRFHAKKIAAFRKSGQELPFLNGYR